MIFEQVKLTPVYINVSLFSEELFGRTKLSLYLII